MAGRPHQQTGDAPPTRVCDVCPPTPKEDAMTERPPPALPRNGSTTPRPNIRELLDQAEPDENMFALIADLPLQQLMAGSQGQHPESFVDRWSSARVVGAQALTAGSRAVAQKWLVRRKATVSLQDRPNVVDPPGRCPLPLSPRPSEMSGASPGHRKITRVRGTRRPVHAVECTVRHGRRCTAGAGSSR